MCIGQHVAVDDQVTQDAVPSRIAVSCLSELSAATFKTDFDVHIVDDVQGLSDRVVAERCHVEHDHIQTTDLCALGDGDVLGGVVGVFAINVHVFLQPWHSYSGIALHGSRGKYFDVTQGLATFFFDFDVDRCPFGHGDVAIFKRQVGQAFGKGTKTAFHDDFLSFDFPVVDIGDVDFREGIMQGKTSCGATFDAEALRMVGAETIGFLCVQDVER